MYSDDRIHEIKAKKMYQDSGETILSSALINEIQVYRGLDNKKIVEVFYSNVDGTFNFEKKFKVNIEDTETIYLTPTVIVNEIVINDGGLNYKVNDKITIKRLTITAGLVEDIAYARVAEVNEFGAITKVEFVNFGVSYVPKEINSDGVIVESNNFLYYPIIDTDIGSEAYLDVGTGFIANYDGFWTNKNSHPDGIKKIADNKRFQEFSYVVRTDRMLDRYVDALKKLAHPAGIEVLGDVLIQKTLVEPTIIQDAFIGVYTPLIGNYAAYRIFTDVNIRNATGYDYIIERELDMNSGSTDAGDFLTTIGGESGFGDVAATIDTSNPEYIQITTDSVWNNRGGIRNEVPLQLQTNAYAPSEIFLTNIDIAILESEIQVTSFDSSNWDLEQCLFGFYRIHKGTASGISVCRKPSTESLIGFRPNSNGKWRISVYIQDMQAYYLGVSSENWRFGTSECEEGRFDWELFYHDTDFSINDKLKLKDVVYSGTLAKFYINDIFITEVNSSELLFPLSNTVPDSLVSEHDSPPYLNTDPRFFDGPQPLFAGIELRQKATGNPTMSAKVYSMNYKQLQLNTNSQVTDLFPNGFDPEEIIPPQDGVNDFEHQTATPISQYVSSTKFKYLPTVSDINEKNNYWVVYPHPNTEINNTTDTTAFMDIKLIDFLKQER